MTITTRGAIMGLSNTVESAYFNIDAVSALGADNKNFLGKNLDQLINNAKKS